VTLWQRVVQANRPGPAEHSITFRVASAAAVIVAIAACWSQQELSTTVAVVAIATTLVGNVLSYWRREHPWKLVKPLLAACAVGGFVWFITAARHTATPGDIATVEAPLAVLFAWVLCTHAFDVPARRDVAYSLAGSAALMAVAAAQSVDLTLGVYVVLWIACGVWGLLSMWQSMSGARGIPWVTAGGATLAVLVLAALLLALLPAPHVSTALVFPSSSANSSSVDSASRLTDGAGSLPAHAADAGGRTGVGGFLGFARSLDTGVRATLGNEVVMRVRASRPSFWVGQTYDRWDGHSWVQSANPASGPGVDKLQFGSPFDIPLGPDQIAGRADDTTDVQTFYLAQSGPNLVFHADDAQRVYIQSRYLFLTGDGTIVSATSMGAGTVYTVVSDDTTASAVQLRQSTAAPTTQALKADQQARYLQLPHPYPKVAALARQITTGTGIPGDTGADTYDKVAAIQGWMSAHITYTTDIPPLARGADAVTTFLFGTRRGFCEQISTATVVMLRQLGIPARETVGYVPGPYNPVTDLYDVQAKDAHAWVQVWFPGYGWQNFDPTAQVPLANPSPGSVLARGAGHAVARLPWVPITVVVALVATGLVLGRRRRRRQRTWAHQVADDLERGGQRLGLYRRIDETLSAWTERLAGAEPPSGEGLSAVSGLVERYSYGGVEPSARQIVEALAFSRRFRTARRPRPGPGGKQWTVGHQPARLIEGQRGLEPVRAPVQRHQLARVGGALDDHHLVVGTGQADHLDLGLVLVGPEEGDGIIGLGPLRTGEQVAGGHRAALGGVGPVLDAQWPARRGVMPPGHIPGGHHAVRGVEGLVADHTVVEGEPRCVEPTGLGQDPDADDHQVGVHGGAVSQVHHDGGGAARVRGEPLHPDAGPQGHARRPVQPGARFAHGIPEHPAERRGQRLDHGDPGPEPVAGGGHLRADEPGPDDHEARAVTYRFEVRADGQAVVEGPQGTYPGHADGAGQ
jgi:transglutaminase-like putative cysteine protease